MLHCVYVCRSVQILSNKFDFIDILLYYFSIDTNNKTIVTQLRLLLLLKSISYDFNI